MVLPGKYLLTTAFILGFVFAGYSAITATNNAPSVGCADMFTTSLTNNNPTFYQWEFGPGSYPSSLSGATLSTAATSFLTAGNHTVIVYITNSGGTIADSVNINVATDANNSMSLTANIAVCRYDSVYELNFITFTGSGATAPSTYAFFIDDSLWQSGAANTFTSSLQFGDSVRVYSFNGTCFTGPSNTLYEHNPPPPTLSSTLTTDTICSGAKVIFTALPANYDEYYFSVGGSYQQKSPANTYITTTLSDSNQVSVRVIENGCYNYFPGNSITVIVKPTPAMSLTIAPDSVICQGAQVTFAATASQAATDSFIFFVNSVDVLDNSAGTPTYTTTNLNNGDQVDVEGSLNGCYSKASNIITMTVNPPPTAILSSLPSNDSICAGQSITFTSNPGGYSNYNFENNGISLQNSPSQTFTTTALTPGNNNILVIVTNQGCPPVTSTAVPVVVNPPPAVTLPGNQSACVSDGADTLTGFIPTGGTWTGNVIINDTTGVFSPSLAGVGSHLLTYTYADSATGCSSSPTLTFTVNPLPTIIITPSSPVICVGHNVQLVASGGVAYNWSTSTGLSDSTVANPTAAPASTMTYMVTGTDNNGCSDTASATVTVNQADSIQFTPNPACSGQASSFTANTNPPAGTTIEWEFGDGGSSNASPTAMHVYTSGRTYDVRLITTVGTCSDTTSQQVLVFQNAHAEFYASPTVSYSNDSTPPIQFVDLSTGAQTYSWDFGDQGTSTLESPTHVYANPGVYTVTLYVTNQAGCNDSLTRTDYIVINPMPKMFIPNAFAPDGYNKILHVYSEGLKFMDWNIFDRSGEKVYESHDISDEINVGWDGKYKGSIAPEGVYVYTLKAIFEDNSQRFYKGSITLLR